MCVSPHRCASFTDAVGTEGGKASVEVVHGRPFGPIPPPSPELIKALKDANALPITKTNSAKFENGASRSHHAPRYELIPKSAVDRLISRLEFGATIHGDNNWRLGGPEFILQCKRHMMEHMLNYLEGDTTDDHLAAVLCNAAFLCHFEAHERTKEQGT